MSTEVLASDPSPRGPFPARGHASNVCQSYEWGQVRQREGWEPHLLPVTPDGSGARGALVLSKALPGLGRIFYSPSGPPVDWSSRAEVEALLGRVRDLAREKRAIMWRVEPRVLESDAASASHLADAGFERLAQTWSYWNRPKYEMHLALDGGADQVFSKIGSGTRNKVRQAGRQGVVVEPVSGAAHLDVVFGFLTNTSRKKQILLRSREYYRHLHDVFERSGRAQAFLARRGPDPIAAGMTAAFDGIATGVYIGSNYVVRNANYALQWEMIRWAIERGCHTYDFAGTGTGYPPTPGTRGYGVYMFKRQFAAEIVVWYGYADLVFRRLPYRALRAAERALPYGEKVLVHWPKKIAYALGRGPHPHEHGEGAAGAAGAVAAAGAEAPVKCPSARPTGAA